AARRPTSRWSSRRRSSRSASASTPSWSPPASTTTSGKGATQPARRRRNVLATFVYFILPIILLCIGFPIYLILLITSLVAIVFVADAPLTAMQTYMFGGLDNFPLLAIPFFILAGEIMGQGGIAKRVIVWVTALTGSARGSLAITTIASSELLGA